MEKDNKKFSLKKNGPIWTIWNLIEATLLTVMGVLTIINCQDDGLHKNLFIIISVFLIIGGALRILANYVPIFVAKKSNEEDKIFLRINMSYGMGITGAIELALGIASLVAMTGDNAMSIITYITNILVYFISILFIVGGASLVLFSVGFIITKLYKLYVPIIEIIFGLATAGLGVVTIVMFSNNDKQIIITVLLVIVGALLILYGIGEAIMTIKPLIKERKNKKKVGSDIVEAETEKPKEGSEEVPAVISEEPTETK